MHPGRYRRIMARKRTVGRESEAHPAFSIILSLVSNVIICRLFKVIYVAFHVSVKA
jgi:hypothetical protein